MIIAYASRSNLAVALVTPDFIRSFHLSDTDRGLLNSAFFWAYAVLQIPAGWVVDRYGVKWPYAISFLFWCVASAATALAGSVAQLIALRVLLGVGESVVAPASYRWIRLNFAERRRGLAVGLYMTGTKIGPAIGAPLAAWLILHRDWKTMFVAIGLGGLIWLIPWLLLVEDGDNGRRGGAPSQSGGAVGAKPVSFGRVMASLTWGGQDSCGGACYGYFVSAINRRACSICATSPITSITGWWARKSSPRCSTINWRAVIFLRHTRSSSGYGCRRM